MPVATPFGLKFMVPAWLCYAVLGSFLKCFNSRPKVLAAGLYAK